MQDESTINGAAPDAGAVLVTDLSARLEGGDLTSYLTLRQSIDQFEATAIAYYATGKTLQARTNRALEVQGIVDAVKENIKPDDCPPGMRPDGYGNCVPKDGYYGTRQ
ncbi:MAG TPA: hypothetical protein VJX74_00080 [Blastocatellia bacterium]|nr:hypothetical protein [Blastocatellia bacterium]